MRSLSRCKRVLVVVVGGAIGFNGVVVAVAPGRLQSTYGIALDDPDVAVLLRHRAVMLALLGLVLVASAWRRELRPAAFPAAALSMASFALFALTADVNDLQQRVAITDAVLLVLLAAAAAIPDLREPRRPPVARP